jgi:hypothetical protein
MIIALLFLILFAILFPKALRFLFALLFIGGIMILGKVHAGTTAFASQAYANSDEFTPTKADVSSLRAAERWCSLHPDARENGVNEHLISIRDCAKRIMTTPAMAADDWATATVRAWKLAIETCTIDNLKSRACMRADSIDAKLVAHGCMVTMAMWWCPVPQKAGFRCDDAFDEKGAPIGCIPILPGKRSP